MSFEAKYGGTCGACDERIRCEIIAKRCAQDAFNFGGAA